jgi:hypothetical protein
MKHGKSKWATIAVEAGFGHDSAACEQRYKTFANPKLDAVRMRDTDPRPAAPAQSPLSHVRSDVSRSLHSAARARVVM